MKPRNIEINMTTGNLWFKIIRFAVPLMLSGILQLAFNMADVMVVGKFSGDAALAAVGLSAPLIHLIINVFIGLSLGVTIIGSRYYGQHNEEGMEKTAHTAILISIISGIFLMIAGNLLTVPMMELMNVPYDVLPLSVLYVRVYFLGMPFTMLYNFSSGIMRSYGDTKRPLYYLCISGVINVILNLIFVIGFKMSVAGVALATAISQMVSAILNMITLAKLPNSFKVSIKKLKIHTKQLKEMVIAGVPAGIQSCMFSVSNIMIQSSINYFGTYAIAGSSAESNIDNFLFATANAISNTAVTATSQNLGAKKIKNIMKVWKICLIYALAILTPMQILSFIFSRDLLYLFTNNPLVVDYGVLKLKYIFSAYTFLGIMEVSVGGLRGLGRSMLTMIISIFGVCILRIVWIKTVAVMIPTLGAIYISYPVSWIVSAIVQATMFFISYKEKLKSYERESENA